MTNGFYFSFGVLINTFKVMNSSTEISDLKYCMWSQKKSENTVSVEIFLTMNFLHFHKRDYFHQILNQKSPRFEK